MAVFRFMQQSSDPGAFPSRRQLLQAGRSDLADAILQAGGWLAIGWETDEEEAARGVAPASAAARLPSGVANSPAERDDPAAPSQPPDADGVDLGAASAAQNPGAAAVATAELDELRRSCGPPSTADDVVKAGNGTAKPTGSRRLKKQRGYWGFDENVSRELRAFAKEAGHPSTAPAQEEVYAARRMDLYHALKRRGGWGVVPQLFGLHQDTTLTPGETGDKIAGPHRQQGTVARAPNLRPATSPMTDHRQATVRREQGLPHQSQRPLLRTVEAAVPTLGVSESLEVREGIIQRTRSELRSTRAQVSALEGALAVEDWSTSSNPEAGDNLLAVDGHGSVHVTRVVWPDPASTVFLTGSYDNWSTQTQLEKSNAGVFVATLQLCPGRYQIKFIVDGVWRVDPRREIVYSDGHENNQLTIL
eukprot:SM000091S24566  [mRNA]  locus=s91:10407:14053:+ [translate_table: standard]